MIDLHGRIDEVICLRCRQISDRQQLHERLTELNPEFGHSIDVTTAPDGDVDLEDTAGFRLAPCLDCDGPLKPHVVFFGENVPRDRVDQAFAAVDEAQALLVAGSSLTVMSGLRFVRHAARAGKPIVIVNRGITRGDPLATCRVDAGCSPTLHRVGWTNSAEHVLTRYRPTATSTPIPPIRGADPFADVAPTPGMTCTAARPAPPSSASVSALTFSIRACTADHSSSVTSRVSCDPVGDLAGRRPCGPAAPAAAGR